jgi:hypothetical protein
MMSIRNKTIGLFAACGAAAVLALAAPAYAESASGACAPTKVKYVIADTNGGQQHTGQSTFKNISQGSASISVPDGGGCVIVRFSAQTFALNSEIIIRAVIDDATFASPAENRYSGFDSGDTSRSYAFDFVFPDVSGGAHKIQMQYRSLVQGEQVWLTNHSMIVQY